MVKTNTRTISVRVSEKLATLLERDARHDVRSIGTQARYILVQHYRAKGELNGEDDKEA
jgi:hypothetical protein